MRTIGALTALLLLAGGVSAKGGGAGSYIVVVPTAAGQPGDSCVPEGVASGKETVASDGTLVLARGVHGANSVRCPSAAFPLLATTQKLPPESVRNAPSIQCVPPGTRAGEEVTIDFYGVATVLEVRAVNGQCSFGLEASVISSAARRSGKAGLSAELTDAPAVTRAPTDAEIQLEYDRLFAAADPVKEFHVRHILVGTREQAQAALQAIRSGRSFAEVAAAVSLDPSARINGGDLGWNGASAFVEEFSRTMVSLEPAGLAPEPTRTRFGWHVIEVLQAKVGKDSFPALSEVKERVAAKLRASQSTSVPIPIKALCKKMVAPERGAVSLPEGVSRTVIAEVRVENGRVAQVLSLSGPAVLHPSVTQALTKYECDRVDRPVLATQTFEF